MLMNGFVLSTKVILAHVWHAVSIYIRPLDVLLCHDDELEGRRIAFILYLVADDWNPETDGGHLQLFDCHSPSAGNAEESVVAATAAIDTPSSLNPWKMAVSLPPKRNMFAFFEVSPGSFHQVGVVILEVQSPCFCLPPHCPAFLSVFSSFRFNHLTILAILDH